jgi:hypothetical protein
MSGKSKPQILRLARVIRQDARRVLIQLARKEFHCDSQDSSRFEMIRNLMKPQAQDKLQKCTGSRKALQRVKGLLLMMTSSISV